jgi:small-conductance mechanosensitive channel
MMSRRALFTFLILSMTSPALAGPASQPTRLEPAGMSLMRSPMAEQVTSSVRGLLAREPPGWDRASIRRIGDRIGGGPSGMSDLGLGMAGMLGGHSPWRVTVSLLLLAGTVLLLQRFVGYRPRQALAGRWQAAMARRVPDGAAAFFTAILAAVLPTLVPLAFYVAALIWSRNAPPYDRLPAITADFCAAWALVTFLLFGTEEILGRRVLGCPQGPARYLIRSLRAVIVFGLLGFTPLYVAGIVGAPADELAFLWFVYKAILFVLVGLVFLRKSAVMAAFPDHSAKVYRRFLAVLSAVYYPVLVLTVAVAILELLGWRDLAEFVWRRTWFIAGFLLALIFADHVLASALRHALRHDEDEPAALSTRRTTARELERACLAIIRVAEIVFMVWVGVRLFGVEAPLARIVTMPMVQIGAKQVSAWLLLQAAALIVGAALVARLIRTFFDYKLYPVIGFEPGVGSAINTVISIVFLLAGTLLAMRKVGIDLRAIAIFTGALGVGVGFGLQHIVNNVVSGLTLIFGRALQRGDWVTVEGQRGRIEEIGMRSTMIRSRDNVEFFVPNAMLLQTTIINWTHEDPRARFAIPFTVETKSDPDAVRKIMLEAAREHPRVLARPAPEVLLREVGEKGLRFDLLVWIDVRETSETSVRSDLYFRLLRDCREAGIAIPFPELDVHLKTGWPPEASADGGASPSPPAAKPAGPRGGSSRPGKT